LDFHGSICAIVTPFDGAGALDLDGFARLLDLHRARGTQGIVVGGSTGESASIDEGEFRRLLAFALQRVGGHLQVIAGCGAPATHKALQLIRAAASEGAHGALVVTPYYVRPTQEGLYRHYALLGEQGGLPVLLYNVPGRTGCDLLPETVARLVARTGIAGVKEARPERERIDALLALRRPGFALLSGDDPSCVDALLAGADGVISVAANVSPGAFRALVDLARAGHAAEARALDAQFAPIYRALALESNPIPAKWLLHRLGLIGPGLRLPLLELSAHCHAAADEAVALVRTLEAHHPAPSHGSRAA
jgi:4-hydroxy-tetrahydrodipicolinate synthase